MAVKKDRKTLERMRSIRAELDADESPYRRLRIAAADRRIARLEDSLGEPHQPHGEKAPAGEDDDVS